jgi:hypothetical protein
VRFQFQGRKHREWDDCKSSVAGPTAVYFKVYILFRLVPPTRPPPPPHPKGGPFPCSMYHYNFIYLLSDHYPRLWCNDGIWFAFSPIQMDENWRDEKNSVSVKNWSLVRFKIRSGSSPLHTSFEILFPYSIYLFNQST